ncbi:MAG: enoyl-CoA hydratase/isomerase family protein [Trebonia sp.]
MAIDVTVAEGVATVTINRPDRLNAMDPSHYGALSQAWQRVRDDPAIRVAVITGAGDRSFSVGADIRSSAFRGTTLADVWQTQANQLLNRGLEVWKPVIAAVNGYCLGGGLTLLLATDIRVAVPHATFGLPEVTRGLLPGNGGTQRVLQQLPYPVAMKLLLGGEPIEAAEAERRGLVNEIVPAERLMEVAYHHARRIAANAPLAVQAAKELAIRSRDVDLASGLRMEQAMNRVLQGSEDVSEGARAFTEKRPPRFEGR